MSEEKRFKHKLNMLEPGTRMLKCIGILILIQVITCTMRYCSDCDKREIFGQLIKRATYSCETYR